MVGNLNLNRDEEGNNSPWTALSFSRRRSEIYGRYVCAKLWDKHNAASASSQTRFNRRVGNKCRGKRGSMATLKLNYENALSLHSLSSLSLFLSKKDTLQDRDSCSPSPTFFEHTFKVCSNVCQRNASVDRVFRCRSSSSQPNAHSVHYKDGIYVQPRFATNNECCGRVSAGDQ